MPPLTNSEAGPTRTFVAVIHLWFTKESGGERAGRTWRFKVERTTCYSIPPAHRPQSLNAVEALIPRHDSVGSQPTRCN
jgi:hypothetical protein